MFLVVNKIDLVPEKRDLLAFIADPEWREVFAESRSDGPLIAGLENVFLDPTDFSPMR